MAKDKLNVPDVHCDHCVTSIEGSVGVLAGVYDVEVDIDSRSVAVTYDDSNTDRQMIVRAIEDQGYSVAG